jgi:anti-sigma-K factor RskA
MNQNIHELAEAYAVGALSDSEHAEYSAHLDSCEACRREVAELLDVTAAMAQSVAADPPPGLRSSVLAAIAETPQESADPGRHAAPDADADGEASNVVPIRRSWTTRVSSLVAAAAVLAALAFGGLWWQSNQDADDAVAQTNELTTLLSADDVRTVPGASQQDGHSGTIVMSRSEGKALFVASDLPDLPSDQVYEAWTIKDSKPVPAGTFTPDDTSSIVALPAASFDAEMMAITVEPQGGSDAPTTDPVVTFTMPQA